VEIRVQDTGMGITAEELLHVFSRFGVAHTTPSRTWTIRESCSGRSSLNVELR
jgi:signal transduction histidine kinase